MHFPQKNIVIKIGCVVVVGSVLTTLVYAQSSKKIEQSPLAAEDAVVNNAAALLQHGRNIFRYDTYGDETF